MMARAVHLNEASPTFSSVLAKSNGLRLIVAARGAFYALQERAGNGCTRVWSFTTGRAQTVSVGAVSHDPAPSIREAIGLLSDNPGDCDRVPLKLRVRVAP